MYTDPSTNFVISLYRPFPGREEELHVIVKTHWSTLREAGLVTEHQPLVLQAADGTFLEIFEWNSPEAVRQAHEHPAVQAIWGKMGEMAEFTTLASLPEADKPFPPFRRA